MLLLFRSTQKSRDAATSRRTEPIRNIPRLPLRCSGLFASAVMGFMHFVRAAAAGAVILGLVQPQGLIADAQGGTAIVPGSCMFEA